MPEDDQPPAIESDAWWEEATLTTEPIPADPFPSALTRKCWCPTRQNSPRVPSADADYAGTWFDDEAYEMSGFEFTIRLVEALAWPVVVLLIFAVSKPLRETFSAVLQRIKRQADSNAQMTVETPLGTVALAETPTVPVGPAPAKMELDEPVEDTGTWTS